jgi:hypothetical protein
MAPLTMAVAPLIRVVAPLEQGVVEAQVGRRPVGGQNQSLGMTEVARHYQPNMKSA